MHFWERILWKNCDSPRFAFLYHFTVNVLHFGLCWYQGSGRVSPLGKEAAWDSIEDSIFCLGGCARYSLCRSV